MNPEAKMKALHNAMPSTLETTIPPPVVFADESFSVDELFIFGFSMKMKTFSV